MAINTLGSTAAVTTVETPKPAPPPETIAQRTERVRNELVTKFAAHQPAEGRMEACLAAMQRGRTWTWFKDEIAEAGGAAVRNTCLGYVMTAGTQWAFMLQPDVLKTYEEIDKRVVDGPPLRATEAWSTRWHNVANFQTQLAHGTCHTAARLVTDRWVDYRKGNLTPRRGPGGLRGFLVDAGIRPGVAGEDVLKIYQQEAPPETLNKKRFEKTPRFLVLVPKVGEGPVEHRESVQDVNYAGLANRYAFAMNHSMLSGGNTIHFTYSPIGITTTLPAAITSWPEEVVPGHVLGRHHGYALCVGVRKSGVLTLGVDPQCELWAGVTDIKESPSAKVYARFWCSLVEFILEWAKEENRNWEEVDSRVIEQFEQEFGVQLRPVAATKPKGPIEIPEASWAAITAVQTAVLSEGERVHGLKVAQMERALELQKMKTGQSGKWTSREGFKEIEQLVKDGRLRAAYTRPNAVVLCLNPVRFLSPERVHVGRTYTAGVYELPPIYLWIPVPLDPDTMLAIQEDGNKHPHPHVYRTGNGKICWGRTDDPNNPIPFGEWVLIQLFDKGWGAFVDEMSGFFGQWHDDPHQYAPLVAVSKRVGDAPKVSGMELAGVVEKPAEGATEAAPLPAPTHITATDLNAAIARFREMLGEDPGGQR